MKRKQIDIIDVMLAVRDGELKIIIQDGFFLMENTKSGERVRLNKVTEINDSRCCESCGRHDGWNGCGEYFDDCMQDYDTYSIWIPKEHIKEDF